MVDRPKILEGSTTEIKTGCGKLYVTVAQGLNDEKQMYREVKCQMGKSGGCQSCWMDYVSGLITLALTAGVSKKSIIQVGRGIQCPNPTVSEGVRTLSCPDAIAIVLQAKNKPLDSVPPVETPEEAMLARPTGDLPAGEVSNWGGDPDKEESA